MKVYIVRDKETDLYLTKDFQYTKKISEQNWFTSKEIERLRAIESEEVLNQYLIYTIINPKVEA